MTRIMTNVSAINGQRNLEKTGLKMGKTLEYAQEGSVFIGGAALQWLRDGLQLVRSAQEVNLLADSVPDSGGVFLVPAFAGLGAPHWDPYARGLIIGISRDTSAAHLEAFYQPFREARKRRFDGLIVTGAPIEHLAFEEVSYWDELTEVFTTKPTLDQPLVLITPQSGKTSLPPVAPKVAR